MNAIVTTIRRSSDSKITQYKDYDIIFSGDFNINMIQRFPSNMVPTFLKCAGVLGQETIIYTNKDNAPSSFGGDNKGEFNPTNIDFAVYYPKVTLKIEAKPAKQAKPAKTTVKPAKPGKPGKPTGMSSSSKIVTGLSTDKIENLSASKVATVNINARLKEGYTKDDFIKVISVKATKWLGTKFEDFLTPNTLFGNKFESYLNENINTVKTKQENAYEQVIKATELGFNN